MIFPIIKYVSIAIILSLSLATTQEGLKWLENNSKNDGVVVLPSGLQYKVDDMSCYYY
jgi:hypothetical protein